MKNFQNNLLNNIILRGVKAYSQRYLLRKSVKEVVLDDGNYVQKDGWVLDTVGTNLRDILTRYLLLIVAKLSVMIFKKSIEHLV